MLRPLRLLLAAWLALLCVSLPGDALMPGQETVLFRGAPGTVAQCTSANGILTSVGSIAVLTFNANDTVTCPVGFTGQLIVVGGGGGASSGGGGAGQYVYKSRFVVPAGSTTIVIGSGGAGANPNSANAASGSQSSFGSVVALGGGPGAKINVTTVPTGGGSGGGCGSSSSAACTGGVASNGSNGGNITLSTVASPFPSAGGGGAVAAGNPPAAANASGAGGAGIVNPIDGVPLAGGGGGGMYNTGLGFAAGGLGGGGYGSNGSGSIAGSPGITATGGGGGGGSSGAIGSAGGSGVVKLASTGGVPYVGPCDILAAAGTPCVAAHSVVRKMFAADTGNAFIVQRTSDSTFLNISFQQNSLTDVSGVPFFCVGTICNLFSICDQVTNTCSGTGNNLPALGPSYTTYATITQPNGIVTPKVFTNPNSAVFRNRANSIKSGSNAIPTGNSSTTEYMVINTSDGVSPFCCGTYGNMEATVADTGNGHMFALSYTTQTVGHAGTPPGPWPGVDWENGIYSYGPTVVAGDPLTVLAKYNSGNTTWTLKSGDATAGGLTTLNNSAPPAGYTAAFEGGLSLGEGGDGSASKTSWEEGAITASPTTDATDALIQANIVAVYGAK